MTHTDSTQVTTNKSRNISDKLCTFLESRFGLIFLGAWSFCEASFWFILPDYLLIIYSSFVPQKRKCFIAMSLLCSLIGSLCMILLCTTFLPLVKQIVFNLPFTSKGMLIVVKNLNIPNSLSQAFSGIPLKVWIIGAIENKWNLLSFIFLTFISRGARMLLISEACNVVNKFCAKSLKQYSLFVLIIYTVLFLLILSVIAKKYV